jgi:hypothetical protein
LHEKVHENNCTKVENAATPAYTYLEDRAYFNETTTSENNAHANINHGQMRDWKGLARGAGTCTRSHWRHRDRLAITSSDGMTN